MDMRVHPHLLIKIFRGMWGFIADHCFGDSRKPCPGVAPDALDGASEFPAAGSVAGAIHLAPWLYQHQGRRAGGARL